MASNLGSIMTTLLGSDALKGISSASGVSSKDVTSVLSSALPLLLSGAGKQTSGKTASGFASALEQHAGTDISNLASFFKNVDADDGAKIVQHLLGSKTNSAAKDIAKKSGLDAEQVIKILAVAAPLLMSLLGKKTQSDKKKDKTSTTAALASALLSNVDVGSILTSLLK